MEHIQRKETRQQTMTSTGTDTSKGLPFGVGPIDMKALLSTNTVTPVQVKKVLSWTNVLEGSMKTDEVIKPEPLLVSKLIKKSKTETKNFQHPEIEFCNKFHGPYFKDTPLAELSRKPGLIPINKFFHFESYRPRRDSDDDGLDDDDITAIDGIIRKQKATPGAETHRKSASDYTLRMTKGEFIFPYRTYRPKVQVAYRVPPGHVPQAVVIERLHRLYRKTDINLVCQNLGIELSDLIPPPHYGETNERFYQESMFRNRIKICGIDKREFIRTGGKAAQEEHAEGMEAAHKTYETPSTSSESSSNETSSSYSYDGEEELEENQNIHPFIKAKPPFGPQFPLEYFDNEGYDIRSGEEWIGLGYDRRIKKQYPIPGKAFLPMPVLQSRRFFPSLSEVTSANLLKKSDTLDRFRKWLIKERFRRQMKGMGLDDKVEGQQQYHHGENEMQLIARATSTVPSLIRTSTGSSLESAQIEGLATNPEGSFNDDDDFDEVPKAEMLDSDDEILERKSQEELSPLQSEVATTTAMTDRSNVEEEGEVEDDDDSDDENFKQFLDILRPQKENEQDETHDDDRSREEAVKMTDSLLAEIFADPDAMILSPKIMPMIEAALKIQQELTETGKTPSDREIKALKEISSTLNSTGVLVPTSPDVDPFDDDGYERLVYEYNKMKKTHNYDWKWVEVAVFDYNPKTQMYFVRSIFPPLVFAWVNKLYLLFDGEDPNRHGERIKYAVQRRIECEYIMRYNLYIDCLPVDQAPDTDPDTMELIIKRANSFRKSISPRALHKIRKELDLEHKRTHMKLIFDSIVEKHPKLYKPWVIVPEHSSKSYDHEQLYDWKGMHQRFLECGTNSFSYKVTRIQKVSVVYTEEPFAAMRQITESCLNARANAMILTNFTEPVSVEQYQQLQNEQLKKVQEFLQKEWTESILESLRTNLAKIPRSWYNLDEKRWDVFELSKTSRFLILIRCIAEDTIRHMVTDSLLNYVKEFENYTKSCHEIEMDYEWSNDLKTSDFPPPDGVTPPFLLELVLDPEGARYTNGLSSFAATASNVFSNCIESSGGFRDILQLAMTKLLFGLKRYLRPVNKLEPHIASLHDDLMKYMEFGLIPVVIYAKQFERYIHIINLDLQEFIEEWEATSHSAEDVKEQVDGHKIRRREIMLEIPNTIDICFCRVNAEKARQRIVEKEDQIVNAILETYARQLRKQVGELAAQIEEIRQKLLDPTENVREVFVVRKLLYHIHELIGDKYDYIQSILSDYELFERYKFPLPPEDFEAKWDVAMATCRVMKVVPFAEAWVDDFFERHPEYLVWESQASAIEEGGEWRGEGKMVRPPKFKELRGEWTGENGVPVNPEEVLVDEASPQETEAVEAEDEEEPFDL